MIEKKRTEIAVPEQAKHLNVPKAEHKSKDYLNNFIAA